MKAYLEAAKSTTATIFLVNIANLTFNLSLEFRYMQRMELEPNLQVS